MTRAAAARRALLAATTIALCVAATYVSAAEELSRDDEIAAIGALAELKNPTAEDHQKLRGLCEDFLRRFPKDHDAPAVRQRLGLTCAALGDDLQAIRELQAVTGTAKPGNAFRDLTLYALGMCQIRAGEADRARATLETYIREGSPSKMRDHAGTEIKEVLDKIGSSDPLVYEHWDPPPPRLHQCYVLAFVLAGSVPKDVPPDARLYPFKDWKDDAIKYFGFTALPRIYVCDKWGTIRAAGVRGKAIEEALRRADPPVQKWRPW